MAATTDTNRKQTYYGFERELIEKNVIISGKVYIHPQNYNESTLFIGENCIIEEDVCIEADNLYIASNSHIGKGCRLKGKNIYIGENCLLYEKVFIQVIDEFKLGKRGKISTNCVFRCYSINIGIELWCNENADVGGGGCWQESALLEIGDFVHIGKNAMINVCKPVHIGKKTGIGIESMIFTHSAGNGQSVLEGYYHIEKEVWIGNHVSLYSRAFVTPGSVLADGTIVGANAYISGTTSRGLYVGTPAKLKKEIESPNNIVKAQLLKDIIFSQYSNSATIYWNGVAMNDFSENAIYLWENIGQEPLLIENDHNITVGIFLEESCIVSEHYYSSYIVIKEEYIKGKTTEISECLRNTLRREGIILDYDTYTPYKLDYNMLKKRGIER